MPEYLPDGVAEEILSRLPVKSLMKFRSVCKSWYSLITTPYFVSTHLLRSNPQTFLRQYDPYYSKTTEGCSLLFDNQNDFQSTFLNLPYLSLSINIVGSFNGLVCFCIPQRDNHNHETPNKFIIANPSIRCYLSIPLLPYKIDLPGVKHFCMGHVNGFGFDDSTQDYIILCIITYLVKSGNSRSFHHYGYIYSLNSNSWRPITSSIRVNIHVVKSNSFFVNGRFHWTRFKPHLIWVFDVGDETFSQISLQLECLVDSEPGKVTVMEYLGSSIAVLKHNHMGDTDIWVMKEYGSAESWMKLANVGKNWIKDPVKESWRPDLVLGFRNKDEVFLRLGSGHIASENINNKSVKIMTDVKCSSLSFSVHNYVPSLVLLDKQNVNVYDDDDDDDDGAPSSTKRIN